MTLPILILARGAVLDFALVNLRFRDRHHLLGQFSELLKRCWLRFARAIHLGSGGRWNWQSILSEKFARAIETVNRKVIPRNLVHCYLLKQFPDEKTDVCNFLLSVYLKFVRSVNVLENAASFLKRFPCLKFVWFISSVLDARNASFGRTIQNNQQVRLRSKKLVLFQNRLGISSVRPLIGCRREIVAIQENDLFFLQRWADDLFKVLLSIFIKKVNFIIDGQTTSYGRITNLFTKFPVRWFLRNDVRQTVLVTKLCEKVRYGRFARAINTLYRDQKSTGDGAGHAGLY